MKKKIIIPDIVEDTPTPGKFAIQLSEGRHPVGRGDILILGTRLHQHIENSLKLADNYRRQALFGILKLGEFLFKVRSQCPQGEWSKLFSDAQKRLKSPSNVAHVQHFEFSSSTAHRYIKAYESSLQNLKAVERKTFAALPYHERTISPDAEKLVEKATKGAETMTQMYLNLGVIKPKEETYKANFRGGKVGAEANARKRAELTSAPNNESPISLKTEDERQLEQRMLASQDIQRMTGLLDEFIQADRHMALIRDVRIGLARELRRYADLIEGKDMGHKRLTR